MIELGVISDSGAGLGSFTPCPTIGTKSLSFSFIGKRRGFENCDNITVCGFGSVFNLDGNLWKFWGT